MMRVKSIDAEKKKGIGLPMEYGEPGIISISKHLILPPGVNWDFDDNPDKIEYPWQSRMIDENNERGLLRWKSAGIKNKYVYSIKDLHVTHTYPSNGSKELVRATFLLPTWWQNQKIMWWLKSHPLQSMKARAVTFLSGFGLGEYDDFLELIINLFK